MSYLNFDDEHYNGGDGDDDDDDDVDNDKDNNNDDNKGEGDFVIDKDNDNRCCQKWEQGINNIVKSSARVLNC